MVEVTSVRNGSTRHIVWDWNGTLFADNDANHAALNQVCAAFGREPVTLDHWRAIFRRPLLECYAELLGRPLGPDDWERARVIYEEHYARHMPAVTLADDATRVLDRWAASGRTQSLLSMAGHDHLLPLVRERGLDHHFTRIDGRHFDTHDDSKTEHLQRHLERQRLDPAATVLIGDIDDDARAAEAVGARAVLVARGLMTRDRLENTGHPVVDSLTDAIRLLADQ